MSIGKRSGWCSIWMVLCLTFLLAACGSDSDSDPDEAAPPENPGEDAGNVLPTFTLAIVPDTQKYARYSPERYTVQTQWIADHYKEQNIKFTVHLGDVVDRAGEPNEWVAARQAMEILEASAETPYSVLAGNHDVLNSGQADDERDLSSEPFLQHFPASLQAGNFTTFRGADSTGFNSYHIFQTEGQAYLVLALDWRVSEQTVNWAQSVLDAHPELPVILTTHQLLNIAGDGETAIFTEHGAMLWEQLIRSNDQIFLTFNGHHHGEAMMVAKNDYGRDVVMVVVDYQSGFWGGNGMLQLVDFDYANDELDFRSFSPWVAAIPEDQRQPQDELSRWVFSVPLDFSARFKSFNEAATGDAPGNIEGTEAYWILDDAHRITSTSGEVRFLDASGKGNDLTLVPHNSPVGDRSAFFRIGSEAPPFGYAKGASTFLGNNDIGGYYLTTDAPGLIFETSDSGNPGYLPQYTIEAIVRLPGDWTPAENQWSGILNHRPQITQVCNYHSVSCAGSDAALGLNVSSLKEFQWVSTSQNGKGEDNWSWEVASSYWYHIALVNDGERVQMYVDGSLVMRTGVDEQHGLLVEPGQPWSIGINSWEGNPGNLFAGDIAEIRINNRVLEPGEWLYNH
ncbi:LamG domain-containing protein [Marinobacter nanhaiticus D15-8W]|uniref:Serine/threonine protein phosphatase n=1 Tax=Marinobacter nanhaiticus D15-8W TaxID=626887 RepID=N6WWB8_9GAMM|nr:LamG-like jellyroll fold domain-containing protein [Marinobacter nanhaiticus]ENO15886.1 serine/threonine protein phosphatase [Marinobacter nanhaiticus D15-8W]BES73256.1 LamG domain-containing protein [Marinobacter nanhaiticus D15-8W]